MRPRDENKRQAILATAAQLFSSQPFHKVKLDDVAAAAHVGKGTLYIYFSSKEDLYFTLLYEGFAKLVDRLSSQLAEDHSSSPQRLRTIVSALVEFNAAHPELYELMRTAVPIPISQPQWAERRHQLFQLIVDTLRKGIEAGEMRENNPEWTARYIPGMVRSALLFGPANPDQQQLTDHIMALLEHGIVIPRA